MLISLSIKEQLIWFCPAEVNYRTQTYNTPKLNFCVFLGFQGFPVYKRT